MDFSVLLKGHNSKTAKGIIIKINFDLYLIAIIDHIKKPMIVSTETKDIIIAHILKGHYYGFFCEINHFANFSLFINFFSVQQRNFKYICPSETNGL
jgi:hypothetical protein